MCPFWDLVINNVNSNTKNILGIIKRFFIKYTGKGFIAWFLLMDLVTFFFPLLYILPVTLLLTLSVCFSFRNLRVEFFQQFLSSWNQIRNCVLGLLPCSKYLWGEKQGEGDWEGWWGERETERKASPVQVPVLTQANGGEGCLICENAHPEVLKPLKYQRLQDLSP